MDLLKHLFVSSFSFKMVETRELSESVANVIIKKHNSSKSYNAITKEFGTPVSTVCNVIKKFHSHKTVMTFPEHGARKKINEISLQRLVQIVKNTTQDN